MSPEDHLRGLGSLRSTEINFSDPDIQEYDKMAVEKGEPTFEEMLPTVQRFLSQVTTIKFRRVSDAWNAPRTELIEELYSIAKAVEDNIAEQDREVDSTG